MKFIAGVTIAGICCIALITSVAMCFGHDSILVTGAISAIVGIITGLTAYFKGKSKGASQGAPKDTDSRV